MPTSTLSKPSTSQAFFSAQEYRCTANKNKKNGKTDTHTDTSMKGNYYATKWKIYFAAHTPLLDQDILFKRYVTET